MPSSAIRTLLLESAAASALLVVAGPASAQAAKTSANTADDSIVVTGYRGVPGTVLEDQQLPDRMSVSGSAEDIGKLPDNSIVDANSRPPRLTAQRLTGREQVTNSDNRAVEFHQYPLKSSTRSWSTSPPTRV